MKSELLQQVLEGERAVKCETKKDGRAEFLVSEEAEMTLMLDMGHEVLSVARIKKVLVKPDLLVLETHKGERVYVGGDTVVRAVKFADNVSNAIRSAGFSK
mgnify:CR=1 FL=1